MSPTLEGQKKIWIATVGADFDPGCYEALIGAAQYAIGHGAQVSIRPIGNQCVTPYHGLAMMRNLGLVEALQHGATHVLMVDTDIELAETALDAMVEARLETAIPSYDQSLLDRLYRLHEPVEVSGNKPMLLDWAIMSCVLFDTQIFRKGIDVRLFSDHMAIAEEVYYWKYLSLYGVQPWLIPNAVATMHRAPSLMVDIGKARIDTILQDGHYELKFQPAR